MRNVITGFVALTSSCWLRTMSTAFYDDDDRDDFDRHSIASSFMDMASPPAVQEDASEYSFYTHQRSATIQSFDSSTPILQPTNQKQRSASTNIRINTNRLVCFHLPLHMFRLVLVF